MKKIVFILLASLFFVACSKDETSAAPADGRYIGRVEYDSEYGNDNDYGSTFCLTLKSGLCTDFIIYTGAERFNYYRPADISTTGSYPKYTYRINDFTVQARFTDLENFTANLSGALCTHKDDARTLVSEIHGIIALEVSDVPFKLDNRTLDANGDGILDEMQPDLFGK